MKLNDIRNAAIGIVKTAYPSAKVYDEAVKTGFVQGGFVIRIFPIASNPSGAHYRQKTGMISISYKGAAETFTDMNTVYNKLEDVFSKPFRVVSTDTISQAQDRYLLPKNTRREEPEDDRFVFIFDFELFDTVQETQDHELVASIELAINKE